MVVGVTEVITGAALLALPPPVSSIPVVLFAKILLPKMRLPRVEFPIEIPISLL